MDVIEITRPPAAPSARPLAARLSTLDHSQLASVLAGLDRRALSGDDLLDVIAAEARLLAWVQAGMAASLSEFARCPPYVAHPSTRLKEWEEFAGDEAALVLKVSPITASNLVGQSIDAHRRHPHLWAAWRDGLIDHRKVAVVTRTTRSASDAVKAVVDATLFDRSARPGRLSARDITIGQTPRKLQRRAHAALIAADPAAARVRTRTALRNRRLVHGTDPDAPGVGYLSGCDLPLTDIAAAYAHIDAIARGIKLLGDPRLLEQLRADVFLDLLLGNEPSPLPGARDGATPEPDAGNDPAGDCLKDEGEPKSRPATARPGIDLVVPIGLLADLAEAISCGTVAEIAGFGLVPAEVIARLVKQAAAQPSTWCLTAVDDTGRVVKHVRTQHDPTRTMRDFVDGRDRHCRFPGCTRSATACDNDHTIPFEQGGPTCPCNLSPLCRRHHRLKQSRGWHLVIDTVSNGASWSSPHHVKTTVPGWRADPTVGPPF